VNIKSAILLGKMITNDILSKRIVIRGYYLIAFLLFGGLLYFTELSGRITILGNYNVDAIRNLILLILAFFLLGVSAVQRNNHLPNIKRIWPYLIFVFWAWLSVTWSVWPEYTIRDGLKLFYPILIYSLAHAFIRTEKSSHKLLGILRKILMIFTLISVISAAATIAFQLKSGNWLWGKSRLQDAPLAIHPVVASLFVLLEISGWRKITGWRPQWLLIALAVLYVSLSLTRAYVFGLLLAVLGIIWVTSNRKTWRLMIIIFTVTAVFALLVVDTPLKRRMFWRPNEVTIQSVMTTAINDPGRFLSEDYIKFSGRLHYWDYIATRASELRPLLIGAGLGSGRPIMQNSSFSDLVTHGDYAKYLAELGFIGLVLFILLYFILFFWSLKLALKRDLAPVQQVAAATLFAQLILAMVTSLVYDVFWLAFDFQAIAAVLVAIINSGSYKPKQKANS
jgi:hypothetical protein